MESMVVAPRITRHGIINLGQYLDPNSPTGHDWKLFADGLKFTDSWIENTEFKCFDPRNFPTKCVLRAWQERFPINQELPIDLPIKILLDLERFDAASCIQQMMKAGSFLDSGGSLRNPRSHQPNSSVSLHDDSHTHQPLSSMNTHNANHGITHEPQSPQENSYHGPSLNREDISQGLNDGDKKKYLCDLNTCTCNNCKQFIQNTCCDGMTTFQPHQVNHKNSQSVVSLNNDVRSSSKLIDESPQAMLYWNENNTWPRTKAEHTHNGSHDQSPGNIASKRTRCNQSPSLNGSHQHRHLPQNAVASVCSNPESRPFHSLQSVDPVMRIEPMNASPEQPMQDASVFFTYAYNDYKTAHRVAKKLINQGHNVTVDNKSSKFASTAECQRVTTHHFNSATYVIIIYTQEYIREVTDIVSQLNTRFIYDLMVQEFKHRRGTNCRFLPLFDYERIERDSIPVWLRNYPQQPTRYVCQLLQNSVNVPRNGDISIQRVVYSRK